jgi:hypothetical protein
MRLEREIIQPNGYMLRRARSPVAAATLGGKLWVVHIIPGVDAELIAVGDSFVELCRAFKLVKRGERGEHEPAPQRRRRAESRGANKAGVMRDLA